MNITRSVIYRLFIASIVAVGLTACGGGIPGDPPAVDEFPKADIGTSGHDIFLPDNVATAVITGDFDGAMLFAGTPPGSVGAKVSGVVSARAVAPEAAVTSPRDVAGFVAQRPVFNGEASATAVLDTFEALMKNPLNLTYSATGRQVFAATGSALANYKITLTAAKTPTDLNNLLVPQLGIKKKQGGAIAGLPTSIGEPAYLNYTLVLSVVYFNADDIVVSAALVPSALSGTYGNVTSGVTAPGNVVSKSASLTRQTDTFTAQTTSGLADFLFVIDNSGSMNDDQDAISATATDFAAALTGSGLNYQIGTITTDSATLRGTGFTDSLTKFAADIKPGTSGSGTETGIWFAERALQSVTGGDSSNGTVAKAGFPRSGAVMSVIILSDEPDQYKDVSVGGVSFNHSTNLFITRGYRVYSIVNTSGATNDYVKLSSNTGGQSSSITDLNAMPAIMANIAADAGGASSIYQLSKPAVPASIAVTINGVGMQPSTVDGWSYNNSSNKITFHGTSAPTTGQAVVATYVYDTTAQQANSTPPATTPISGTTTGGIAISGGNNSALLVGAVIGSGTAAVGDLRKPIPVTVLGQNPSFTVGAVFATRIAKISNYANFTVPITNNGSQFLCFVKLTGITYRDASGAVLLTKDSVFLHGSVGVLSGGVVTDACIAPGATGLVKAIESDLYSTVAKMEFTIDSSTASVATASSGKLIPQSYSVGSTGSTVSITVKNEGTVPVRINKSDVSEWYTLDDANRPLNWGFASPSADVIVPPSGTATLSGTFYYAGAGSKLLVFVNFQGETASASKALGKAGAPTSAPDNCLASLPTDELMKCQLDDRNQRLSVLQSIEQNAIWQQAD